MSTRDIYELSVTMHLTAFSFDIIQNIADSITAHETSLLHIDILGLLRLYPPRRHMAKTDVTDTMITRALTFQNSLVL